MNPQKNQGTPRTPGGLIDSFSVSLRDVQPFDVTFACLPGSPILLSRTFTVFAKASGMDTGFTNCVCVNDTDMTTATCTSVSLPVGSPPGLAKFSCTVPTDAQYDVTATGNATPTPGKKTKTVTVNSQGTDLCASFHISKDDEESAPPAGVEFERFVFSGERPRGAEGKALPLGIYGMVPAAFGLGGVLPPSADGQGYIPVTGAVLAGEGGGLIQPTEFRSPEPWARDRWYAAFRGVPEGQYQVQVTLGDDPTPAPDPLVIHVAATLPEKGCLKK
jgi:hypothetical protein